MENNTSEIKNEITEEVSSSPVVEKKTKRKKKKELKPSEQIKKFKRVIRVQTVWLIILSLLLTALAGCVFSDELTYGAAKALISCGNIKLGVSLLNRIPSYEKTSDLLDKYKFTVPGNIITFGTYEQDGDERGTEPLEWLVLDYDEEAQKSLIITRYAVDCKPYKAGYGAATWETSDVRTWLNARFLEKAAFTNEELSKILESEVETPPNYKHGTKGGNTTSDRVFLLSDKEFKKYLEGTENAIGYTTRYAQNRGVQSGPISGTSVCWLRTPGESLVYISTISYVGELNSMGVYSFSTSCGIRPAMWIDVSAED